jgi:hypothetical protein
MAGTARSGGQNRKSVQQHLEDGTFRPSRHSHAPQPPPSPVSAADRRAVLQGLEGVARRVAVGTLSRYEGWCAATLAVLRAYALSCQRVEALQMAKEPATGLLHQELRSNLALLRELNLEEPPK